MKYAFQLQGVLKDKTVFTIISDDESGKRLAGIDVCWNHFVMDNETNEIVNVSYMDGYLAQCNTTHVSYTSDLNETSRNLSLSEKVTYLEAKHVLGQLFINDVDLEGIGRILDKEVDISVECPVQMRFPNGHVSVKYYDGTDTRSVISKALANNTHAIAFELLENKFITK